MTGVPRPGSVLLAVDGPVATLTLATPGRQNAIGVAMWRELRAHAVQLAASADVRCVVVQGEGEHFAAGADIAEFARERHDADTGRHYHLGLIAPALDALLALPQPAIAAIRGNCIGGGLEIALCCDLRIAASDARLGAPVGRLGFPLALPELAALLERVRPGVAAELLLTGRVLPADEAAVKGLVERVVARDDLATAVGETVRGVLAGSPLAARLNKAHMRRVLACGPAVPRDEVEASFAFLDSADYREGVAAFLEGRPPRFTGR